MPLCRDDLVKYFPEFVRVLGQMWYKIRQLFPHVVAQNSD